jgi:hypothetical protein
VNKLNHNFAIISHKTEEMLNIKKTYVTDTKNRPVAVQVNIKTFEKIEQVLEDYALGRLIEDNSENGYLSVSEAKEYYKSLDERENEH